MPPPPRTFRMASPPVILLLLLAVSPAAASGQPPDPPLSSPTVIRTSTLMVNLFVTATEKKAYIRDLTAADFQVFENGVRQEIKYFNNLSESNDMPLSVVLAVDTSGSVADKLPQMVSTAATFFDQVIRPGRDMAAVIEFHSDVALIQDFTDNHDLLNTALDRLRPGGNTALNDAVYLAATEKLEGEAGRRILVVMSDGEDTSSRVTSQQAINAAQLNDVMIYGLGVESPRFRTNFRALEIMARETGGRFFRIRSSEEALKRTFDQIRSDINHQYNIAYEPRNQARDGSFREINLRVTRRGIRLTHRKGYFAPQR